MRINMKLLLVIFVLASAGAQKTQKFAKEPSGIKEVMEGETILLECSVENKAGVLQWTKDDFGLGTDNELAGFERYRMIGGPGTWNLEIVNASMEDNGKYQCQVGATETVAPIRSTYAQVSVLAAPQPPVITAGPKLVLRNGKTSMVQCISKGGRPASTIRWLADGVEVLEGVETKVEEVPSSKRMATVSTLTFPVNKTLQGFILECEAANSVDPEPRLVQTALEVEYEPEVDMVLEPASLYEGDKARVMCNVKAVPEQVEYRWEVAGVELVEARGASELLIETERDMNGKTVSCIARNTLGQSSAQITLDVKYAPIFVNAPKDTLGDVGDRVRLGCTVSSNPPPTYTWIKDDLSTEEVGRGEFLSLVLSNRTAGRYTCLATAQGFPTVTSTVMVQVRGPPKIVPGREVQYATVGQPLHVICEADSVPEADGFTWTFRGRELRPGSSLYSILDTRLGNLVRSTLVVDAAEAKHFGEYICTVKNPLGSTSTIIALNEIEAFPLLVVIAGAIGGLLLTVVVVVVLLACRRAVTNQPDVSAWPRSQNGGADRLSTSTNTTTNQDDLDGSDSLPEVYLKSQQPPDLLHSNLIYGSSMNHYTAKPYTVTPTNMSSGSGSGGSGGGQDNYTYRQYGSENNLLDNHKYSNANYSNPYLQSVSPVSDLYRHNAHWSAAVAAGATAATTMSGSYRSPSANGGELSGGYIGSGRISAISGAGLVGGDNGGFLGARDSAEYTSGRFNAVAHSLHSTDIDMNESSVGTHV